MSRLTKNGALKEAQTPGHGSQLGRKKEAAVQALLTQRNVEEAARVAGIGKQTLIRWLKIPEFQQEYHEARRTAVAQTDARLQQLTGAAASTLAKIMVDQAAPAAARVRAADSILNRARHSLENEDIQMRLTALENMAKLPRETE